MNDRNYPSDQVHGFINTVTEEYLSLRGRGGLFQNRETKKPVPRVQHEAMVEAGGEAPGNNHGGTAWA
jgi:hypothetical protein